MQFVEMTPKKLWVVDHFHFVFDQPLSLAWQVLLISATSAGLFNDLSWWIVGLNLKRVSHQFLYKLPQFMNILILLIN